MLHWIRTVAAAALALLATPASAYDKDPNADTVSAILDALKHNPFTVHDPKSDANFAVIGVGPYGFEVAAVDNKKDKILNCYFTYYDLDTDGKQKVDTAMTYYSYGCLGSLDKVRIGETTFKPPTADDQAAYRGFLGFLLKLVPVMQAYVPDVSVPSDYVLGMDFALREKNRALIGTILHQMERSRVTTVDGTKRGVLISGTNKMLLGLSTKISGDHYTSCLLATRSPQGDIAFDDETCSGSVHLYLKEHEGHEVNVWDVATRLNKALTTLERFTRLMSEQFPKK